MKLASLKHGRDGSLIVVSRDLTKATNAADIAPTMQAALDSLRDMSYSMPIRLRVLDLIKRPVSRLCPAPINGSTAPLISTMSSSFAKPAAQQCQRVSMRTR